MPRNDPRTKQLRKTKRTTQEKQTEHHKETKKKYTQETSRTTSLEKQFLSENASIP